MEYVLTVENVTKMYKDFKALDSLSMHVEQGAIYGFVGQNGAGKTSLIRTVCGLQTPTKGGYTLYSTPHNDPGISKLRRRVGALVDLPSFYGDMTALENLRMQYELLGRASFEGMGELLALVGLEDAAKKKTRHFSLGMRQRLGIALALAGDPDFLVLDEPLTGLDPQGIVSMRELLLRLNRENRITILIASPILHELRRMATHYGFIHNGKVVKEVSADALEASCRKCVRMEVSNIEALSRVLLGRKIDYTVTSDCEADVYGDFEVTALVLALAEAGCTVRRMAVRDEGLESYYINLIGGEQHA